MKTVMYLINFNLVDGQVTEWSDWTSCSSGCVKERTRTCTNPAPSMGGSSCTDIQHQTTNIGQQNLILF